ncbi:MULTISPECIES: MFS transporter [unclassified Algibacter]|uniref:MFS transporter n=1 Tax=unclassified Algibacter TaxID=2615009 RepID=UPI00131DAAE9|nr:MULTISPECIES: MFS transporter [unclassified Algibacter]MCL5128338.1 MFS transporter [Algibacter sp. L4_22]
MELRVKQRIALSVYFFLSGICFATWASRIPTIKTFFNLNEAELGTILIAMPVSSLIGLPISGWLVSKFDSRIPLIFAFVCFSISLAMIGFATTTLGLILSISSFAFCLRILNISINTQSITLQKKFEKRVVGAFHGLWSTGGLFGVLYSTIMVKFKVPIHIHLLSIAIFAIFVALATYRYTLKNDKAPSGNKLIVSKPDPYIMCLGLIVFFAAICEGGMFDWSGVYFKEVLKEDVFTYGYLMFMTTMALSRFFSDKLVTRIGVLKTYILSSSLVVIGISMAVLFPKFWTALFGFFLVGFGTAAFFPVTMSLAGNSKKYSPGMAISIITTYAIIGMLIGPPLIGYLAHAFGLRNAFILFIVVGLSFIPVAFGLFKFEEKEA